MDQVAITVLSVFGSIAGMMLFILKLIVPWMKGKIDEKNGSIGKLVERVEELVGAVCALVDQNGQAQAAFIGEAQQICDRKDGQIGQLIEQVEALREQIKEALERAA